MSRIESATTLAAATFTPAPRLRRVLPYAPARHGAPCDLDLGGTESPVPALALLARGWAAARGTVARYPDAAPLARDIAAMSGVESSRVVITAGADEAIDRVCRAALDEGRNAIVTDPTFEMIPRYAALAGGTVRAVPWPRGAYPVEQVIAASDSATALVAIVSPNNPTGTVAAVEAVRRVHHAIPSALVLVDLAYGEYAAADILPDLLALPRVVVTRTFSKAWGMPGIRLGYAVAADDVARWLRVAGGPYPVSAVSLGLARTALADGGAARARAVAAVVRHRARLLRDLADVGAEPVDGEGSFVCATGTRARWLCDALAGQGIATRFFRSATPGAPARLRIAVPPDAKTLNRLRRAIRVAAAPEALLFDLDGVLADVTESYDAAIVQTAAAYGVAVTRDDVLVRRARGNANDDWALTAAIIAEQSGAAVALDEVTAAFERFYQGEPGRQGMRDSEALTVDRDWLAVLAGRLPLAVVTGRPRADAEAFLTRAGIRDLFAALITREDAPLKPSPAPAQAALVELGVTRAWVLGATPDDIVSARSAGVVPIGVAPGDATPETGADAPLRAALLSAGAARIITNPMEISECLP